MISSGDKIYYFEYMDHAKRYGNPSRILKNPSILWCCGKIAEESEDFIAVVCSGTKKVKPSSEPSFEIILKS